MLDRFEQLLVIYFGIDCLTILDLLGTDELCAWSKDETFLFSNYFNIWAWDWATSYTRLGSWKVKIGAYFIAF